MMPWRILPVRELSLRCWNEEWVATDAISGDTHLLSFPAGFILNQLRAGPATATELASLLKFSGQMETVQEYLDALSSLELIEPCPV